MIRLLLDENISPALVGRVADLDVYAQSVPPVGLSGLTDREVWKCARDHDFAVVTTNARDLIPRLDVLKPGSLQYLRFRIPDAIADLMIRAGGYPCDLHRLDTRQ